VDLLGLLKVTGKKKKPCGRGLRTGRFKDIYVFVCEADEEEEHDGRLSCILKQDVAMPAALRGYT